MLTSRLIFWAFFVSVGAVLVLVAIDRRQPARRQRLAPRGRPLPAPTPAAGRRSADAPLAVVRELPTRPYRRTPVWRRLLAVVGLGAMGTVMGAVVAIVLAAAAIAAVLLVSGAAK